MHICKITLPKMSIFSLKFLIGISSKPGEVGFKSLMITSSSFKLIEEKLNKQLGLFSSYKYCRKFD